MKKLICLGLLGFTILVSCGNNDSIDMHREEREKELLEIVEVATGLYDNEARAVMGVFDNVGVFSFDSFEYQRTRWGLVTYEVHGLNYGDTLSYDLTDVWLSVDIDENGTVVYIHLYANRDGRLWGGRILYDRVLFHEDGVQMDFYTALTDMHRN